MNRVLIPQQITPSAASARGDACELRGRTMGTDWRVRLCSDLPPQSWLRQDLQQTLDRLDAQMSHWAPDSDLGIFNRRPAGTWQPIPAAFFDVLRSALDAARRSNGACDPTVGALVNLWGFGPAGKRNAPPCDADIERARARCGWQRLEIDEANHRVLQPGGIELDLSCIAKGYAVDVVAERLLALGLEHFLVEIGGELRGGGWNTDGSPWWGELENPDGSGERTLVALHGLSVATSGDYRQFFEHQGARYAHTLDPRTGRPVAHAPASVSVMHPSCAQADVLATVLSVLGVEAGIAYADALELAALFVSRDPAGRMTERVSRAASAMLE
ncbi:thiamine biosynthesis lipoprotein [Panacagrimonas perspica]|uniref:FAD:protein FMN transferase n=1 Tax=Panacagrimonas perspica TaxID=381431 RepID=A0A4R7PAM7_9GAMM|nr:FAD:protein FMN transferase [Panacagrimonas perspica]TDU30988.1 thiamine biosynthesis lipoprotein [Panacagrimonas perspica]THD01862.1 hypothetical protein B1810_17835 [Panacagrimonas perspica]